MTETRLEIRKFDPDKYRENIKTVFDDQLLDYFQLNIINLTSPYIHQNIILRNEIRFRMLKNPKSST
jgi:hypothetical protein